jgi:hypothetical protein
LARINANEETQSGVAATVGNLIGDLNKATSMACKLCVRNAFLRAPEQARDHKPAGFNISVYGNSPIEIAAVRNR